MHAGQILEIGVSACLSGGIISPYTSLAYGQVACSWLILNKKIGIITRKLGPSLVWSDCAIYHKVICH